MPAAHVPSCLPPRQGPVKNWPLKYADLRHVTSRLPDFYMNFRTQMTYECFLHFQVVDVGSTIYYQALCLVSETTQIKMQCTSTDKIKILRTVYGYNPGYSNVAPTAIDSCAFSIKDCHFDKEYSIDNECTGRNTCLMTISKQRVMNESTANFQTCKEYNYVQINYQCLPSKILSSSSTSVEMDFVILSLTLPLRLTN